jgi:hypothetical protein
MNRKLKILLIVSFLHSMFLLFLTYWLMERNFTYGDERFLIKTSSIIKKMVLGIDNKPPREDFIFINTSYDNMLIDRLDENGFVSGNQAVTDREKLAKFFSIINKKPDSYKYIICDIFFADKSPLDSVLYSQLKKTKNIIIPYHIDTAGKIENPIFDINKGITEYNIIGGSFLKYALMRQDTLASLPLKMYQDLTNASFRRKNLFSFMNNRISFNNVIIDFKIRYYDIFEDKTDNPYPYQNLGELLTLPDSVILHYIQNRIILIGDLQERDKHDTAVGLIPGILVLLNTFLILQNGENFIMPFLILILFIGYFLISIDVFSSKSFTDRRIIQKISTKIFGKFLVKFLGYIFYLGFISVLIYFLYNIHINLLFIAVYLKCFDSILKHYRTEPEIKERKGLVKLFFNIRLKIFKILNPQ